MTESLLDQIALLERRLARSEHAREEAEALLEERSRYLASRSEQFLRSLLDSLNHGVAVFDKRHALVTYNTQFLNLADPETSPVRDAGFALQHEKRALRVEAVTERQGAGDRRLVPPEEPVADPGSYEYRLSDGRTLDVSVIPLANGTIIKSYADISEYVETQRKLQVQGSQLSGRVAELEALRDALEIARNQAVAADRTKSRFLAMMSHDIRTPMNAMLAMLELLSLTDLDTKQARQVELARSSGDQLLFLLADIIEVARADGWALEFKPQVIPVAPFVESLCAAWLPLANRKQLSLHYELAEDLPATITLDGTRLRQVFDNLISNSIKYTAIGSVRVIVKTGERDNLPVLHVAITDTGRGIAQDMQERLFVDLQRIENPFNQPEEGTGLGLSICRRVVEAMGGAIGAESIEGQGSTFWFMVPYTDVDEARAYAEINNGVNFPTLRTSDGARPHILVVEDVETNRIVMSSMLDELDCTYEMAEDGALSLDAFKRGRFDAVLMDVSMPNMDGVEATRLIRSAETSDAHIPIVGVTAFVGREERSTLLASGMDAVIPKPLRLAELRNALSRLLCPQQVEAQPRSPEAMTARIPNFNKQGIVDQLRLKEQFAYVPAEARAGLKSAAIKDLTDWNDRFLAALETSDDESLARAHHALKGICGGFGAQSLIESLDEIRHMPRNKLDARLIEHRALFSATLDAIRTAVQ